MYHLHGPFRHGHAEILKNVVRILAASVTFEGVSHADRLLPVPRDVVQPWIDQRRWIWHCCHVQSGVCVVLHVVHVH